jgi:hypothetical protein
MTVYVTDWCMNICTQMCKWTETHKSNAKILILVISADEGLIFVLFFLLF